MSGLNNLEATLGFFVYIMAELVILFLIITFVVGLIREYVSAKTIRKTLSRKKMGAGNVIGALFGSLTPFCSCSTIPLLIGMLDSGVPFGICMSFLVASPLLNPVIIGMLLTMVSPVQVVLYFGITFIGSVLVGMILEKLGMEKQIKSVAVIGGMSDEIPPISKVDGFLKRHIPMIKRAWIFSWDLFKHMLIYLFIGVAIGAFIYGFIPESFITTIAGPNNPLAIPVAALVGVPMYVRAESVIPIGIALTSKGMSVGAVIALLIGGAGASIPELIMLNGIFKRRLMIAFILTIFSVAILTGFATEIVGRI